MNQRSSMAVANGAGQFDLDLNGRWNFAFTRNAPLAEYRSVAELRAAGIATYPAVVPGNFELDLQANGLLDEPFLGMNMFALREWEHAHVWYWRSFKAEARTGFNAELRFEGLDCFADVWLNGAPLGRTDNMLIEHVFTVDGQLLSENELLIHIRPALDEARVFDYPPLLAAGASNLESLYVRKAPHMYGWDIMPRALSAGLWRPLSLRYRPVERLECLYLETLSIAPRGTCATLRLHYQAHTAGLPGDRYAIRLEGACEASVFSEQHDLHFESGQFQFWIGAPQLWWPRGRGEPRRYAVRATLLKNGVEIDRRDFTLGIRTIELDRTDVTDAAGSGAFGFRVNGERLFVMGTNWVPLDVFHSRDDARLDRAIELATDIGCNLLRCWGGNVYESDRFFDLCDAKGLLVWQDFAMACGVYPQDEAFARRLADEARAVVRRLRQHPSLALWCGDNECDAFYGWTGRRQDPNTNVLTRQALPGVLREEDAGRPYLPSSPYMAPEAVRRGDQSLPENHLWGPRDYFKSAFYINATCHFASEIGYHGCPAPESVRQFITPGRVWPYTDNPEWILHGTSPVEGLHDCDYRVGLMANQVRELFGQIPDTLEAFALASQATQAEAFKFFIELFRAMKWRRTGIIWWNLLDGWPQFSDAVVDYYFRKKLAYDAIRCSQQPLCLVFREPAGWSQELVACNDRRGDEEIAYSVKDVETGETLLAGRGVAAADAVTSLGSLPFSAAVKRFYAIEWTAPSGAGRNHYLAGHPPFDAAWYLACARRTGLVPAE